MDDIKNTEDEKDINKTQSEDGENVDTILFDNTLKQIEKTLKNLGEKIEPKQDPQITKETQDNSQNKNEEHTIDNTHLRMEELHDFKSESKAINNNSFGFYTYLALSIGVIFAIYELLNVYKNLISEKYPASEPYIDYFYEIIEILAYIVLNIVGFFRNLF